MSRLQTTLTVGLLYSTVVLLKFAYIRLLVPLYGDAALKLYLDPIVWSTAAVAFFSPLQIKSWRLTLGVLLAASPRVAFHAAVLTSRRGSPLWGPVVTHGVTIVPVIYVVCDGIKQLLAESILSGGSDWILRPVALLAFVAASSDYTVQLSRPLLGYSGVSDSSFLLVPAGLFISAHILSLVKTKAAQAPQVNRHARKGEKKAPPRVAPTSPMHTFKGPILSALFCLVWSFIALPALRAPVLQKPLDVAYTHPDLPVRILSSEQSVTGTIVVGEGLRAPPALNVSRTMQSVRYLRADHSIIGGVWTDENIHTLDGTPTVRDSHGVKLGDSIYATFVLQEAARLVDSTEKGQDEDYNTALIIGLGAGTAASAFQRHGMSTTIVEIDPAVYRAAINYFGLNDPGAGKVFLEDAGAWIHGRSTQDEETRELFDIVIHDCFSGGGVPEHIYTAEFWEALKASIHPEGILAVNFAGVPASKSSQAILFTLEDAFGPCRGFYDSFETLTEEAYSKDFINIVFFCSPSKKPLTFRKSRRSDHLNSPLRRHVFTSLLEREVNLSLIRGNTTSEEAQELILTKESNQLNKWQASEALHHWSLMREVLMDFFWETY